MSDYEVANIKLIRNSLKCLIYTNKITKSDSLKGEPMCSVSAYNKRKCRCVNCKEWARLDSLYRYNSNQYRKEYNSKRNKIWYLKNKDKRNAVSKKWYQENIHRVKSSRKAWELNNPDIVRKNARSKSRKRRALKKNNGFEPYTESQVLNAYGSLCHICDSQIDLSAPRWLGKNGWEYGLHIDHIIPISKGGPDTLSNVRPSHAICNVKKGAKIA